MHVGRTGSKVKVVFACVHNAGRSQMAAAFYNSLTNSDHGVSGGTHPGQQVHPEVVTVMKEIGIDMSSSIPKLLTNALVLDADKLITMGCGEACPYLPGPSREDWPLNDPKGRPLDEVRAIRDEIKRRVEALIFIGIAETRGSIG